MGRTFAFVDESGNHDLDTSKSGSSGFFVICSIIITEKDLPRAYERAEALRLGRVVTGELCVDRTVKNLWGARRATKS